MSYQTSLSIRTTDGDAGNIVTPNRDFLKVFDTSGHLMGRITIGQQKGAANLGQPHDDVFGFGFYGLDDTSFGFPIPYQLMILNGYGTVEWPNCGVYFDNNGDVFFGFNELSYTYGSTHTLNNSGSSYTAGTSSTVGYSSAHIFKGNGNSPQVIAGPGLGTGIGASGVFLDSNAKDSRMNVILTGGANSIVNNPIFSVKFNTSLENTPYVFFSPTSSNVNTGFYVLSQSTTGFVLSSNSPLISGNVYKMNIWIVE